MSDKHKYPCEECSGKRTVVRYYPYSNVGEDVTCEVCDGTGKGPDRRVEDRRSPTPEAE